MPSVAPLTPAQKALVEEKYKERINQEIVNALKIAKILVRVKAKDFRDVLSGKYDDPNTVAKLEMQYEHSRVKIFPAQKDPSMQSVHIWPGGATIRFKVVSDTKGIEFHPIGIAFVRKEGSAPPEANGDRVGALNFDQSQTRPYKQFLYVTDSYKDNERDDAYKFSIIIQCQSNGAIGIIDPDIEHEH